MGIEAPLIPAQAVPVHGTAAGVAPTTPTVVTVQGIAGGTPIPTTGGGGAVDVSDRAGRLLGIVASVTAPVDISDRAARALGVVASVTAPVDISDRAARALGVVASVTAPVDVSDRAARALGVVASITAPVDVSDRAGRLVGVVDTELPAAAALADAAGNPTTPTTGSGLLGFNTVSWDRLRSGADNADAIPGVALGILKTAARLYGVNGAGNWDRVNALGDNADGRIAQAASVLQTLAEGYMFNGTTWDRMRGDTSAGLRVAPTSSTLVQAASPAANTAATLTLPAAGAGLFHYITHLYIARHATAALAGGATLAITTTNLNGLTWRTGNQASITVSVEERDPMLDTEFTHPIRSAVANTASTIVLPAPGAAVLWTAWVAYYVGP